jgi:hypothetical protein
MIQCDAVNELLKIKRQLLELEMDYPDLRTVLDVPNPDLAQVHQMLDLLIGKLISRNAMNKHAFIVIELRKEPAKE